MTEKAVQLQQYNQDLVKCEWKIELYAISLDRLIEKLFLFHKILKFWKRRNRRLRQSWRQMRRTRRQSRIKSAFWLKSSKKLISDSRRRRMRWRKSMTLWHRVKLVGRSSFFSTIFLNLKHFSRVFKNNRLTSSSSEFRRLKDWPRAWPPPCKPLAKLSEFSISKKSLLQNSFIVNNFICFCITNFG